jgi:hypothetical protein
MIFSCCDEKRRAAILGNTLPGAPNGIDYLEVLDRQSPVPALRQQTLLVYFLKPVTPAAPLAIAAGNILLTGGESITNIFPLWVALASTIPTQIEPAEKPFFQALSEQPNAAQILIVRTSQWGDFSPYTLRLVTDATAAPQDPFTLTETLAGYDPILSQVCFSFKAQCGPAFDCTPQPDDCPPQLPTPPPINYLAKDYTSFRQVMLDRMSQLLPNWGATSEADIGIMLAEAVCYVADQLSYKQDAVTTEAYLMTARSRISLRRHALLVDYRIHEGANARVFVQVAVSAPKGEAVFLDRKQTRFYTTAPNMPASLIPGGGNEQAALDAGCVVFEPMQDANLFSEHNRMHFHTWGDVNCCLPAGATEATLRGTYPNLQPGDVLIFAENKGPQTGNKADADIRHRCAVRLTQVTTTDAAGKTLVDPLFDASGVAITTAAQTPQPVTEIQWSGEDSLPFPVCVSSQYVDDNQVLQTVKNVSIVLGNVVLADHGLSMPKASLGAVPAPSISLPSSLTSTRCKPSAARSLPVRFNPSVPQSPLTQHVALPRAGAPSTPSAVPLTSTGAVALRDANGFTTLTVAANQPASWPQQFAVQAAVNGSNPALVDLEVVFLPTGGGAQVVLERYTGLSFNNTDPGFVLTALGESALISVPGSFSPPTTPPTAYPSAPTPLTSTGIVNLKDASHATWLEVEATNPLNWPALFSVVAQDQLATGVFNLLMLYNPQSGSVGVTLPVIVEQFDNISLANIAAAINIAASLITVQSFESAPNPALSATALMDYDASAAMPAIHLHSVYDGDKNLWTVVPDLLDASDNALQFVIETDTSGTAYLRFGDGVNGSLPDQGTSFTAHYRIGNGTAGNVGAGSLVNLTPASLGACTNPLPAAGGIDPETNAQIRRRAPQAFMTQERAITMTDYASAAVLSPQIEDAYAVARWTGSWYTIFVTAEPLNNAAWSKSLERSLTKKLNQYRLAGQDLAVKPPDYVPLTVELAVCVDPAYVQRDVQKALVQALGSGTLPNGQPAYFSPQNFELGQAVYLSPLYAAARNVAGVQTVQARVFEPQGMNTTQYLQQGYIPMGAFQVAQLANDPSLPSHGRLTLRMQGGR